MLWVLVSPPSISFRPGFCAVLRFRGCGKQARAARLRGGASGQFNRTDIGMLDHALRALARRIARVFEFYNLTVGQGNGARSAAFCPCENQLRREGVIACRSAIFRGAGKALILFHSPIWGILGARPAWLRSEPCGNSTV